MCPKMWYKGLMPAAKMQIQPSAQSPIATHVSGCATTDARSLLACRCRTSHRGLQLESESSIRQALRELIDREVARASPGCQCRPESCATPRQSLRHCTEDK